MSKASLLLNCDLGEGGGEETDCDAAIMPFIDQANIACGYHAGSPLQIHRTIELAIANKVSIGAHPSYPDRENFGRQSMVLEAEELIAALHYQIAALDGMALSSGSAIAYVKPHGALYNDMMRSQQIRAAVLQAIASYHRPLDLMLQATPEWKVHADEASTKGISLQLEAFADRRYLSSGVLQPRSEQGSVLTTQESITQVGKLLEQGKVDSADGTSIELRADTLCVHGDSPGALESVKAIRGLIAK